MAYQALYRRWRPERFADMVGQDAITTALKNQIIRGRVAHAYLLCGSRGTGKTSTAKILARAINCQSSIGGEPCLECEACVALAKENNMDVIEIDAASNNGVDEIRDLREKIKFPPTIGRYRVYIIDEVHMLSTGAFNALLKTLEEPPAHAVFILATTEPQRLPATVLSRCQRYDFRRIAAADIASRLRLITDNMGVKVQDAALSRIAHAAHGGMRDAQSILEMCISYAADTLTDDAVRDVLGAADDSFLAGFVDAMLAGDMGGALRMIDQLMAQGRDALVFARDVTSNLRALLLAGAVSSGLAELLETTEETAARYCEAAKRAQPAQLMRLMDLFIAAESDMRWATLPRTVLELCAARACAPEGEQGMEALSERVSRLESGQMAPRVVSQEAMVSKEALPAAIASAAQAGETEGATEAGLPWDEAKMDQRPADLVGQTGNGSMASVVKEASPAPELTPDDIQGVYQQGLALLRKQAMSAYVQLVRGALGGLSGDVLEVEFQKDAAIFKQSLEQQPAAVAAIEAAMSEVFGRKLGVHLSMASAAPAKPEQPSMMERRTLGDVYDFFSRENVEVVDE